MINQGKEKGDPHFFDTLGGLFWGQLDIGAERHQHVGAATLATHRAVAMFGDFDAVSGHDKGGGRADIKGMRSVAAGATGVN